MSRPMRHHYVHARMTVAEARAGVKKLKADIERELRLLDLDLRDKGLVPGTAGAVQVCGVRYEAIHAHRTA